MFHGVLGQTFLVMGLVLVGIGLIVMLVPNIPFLGKLPGDVSWQTGNVRVYAPLATSILLSIILTVVVNLLLSARR